jgi:selenocysteine lyase/cysteine desulfurase
MLQPFQIRPTVPGLRFSPHFYNTHADIEKTMAAVRKYMVSGV